MPTSTEKEVIVHHRIMVDACIADEVEELNNKYGIVTIHCCCGHGFKKSAFISVRGENRESMFNLGYEDANSNYNNVAFKPKSKCTCKTTRKCTICHKVRRGWNQEPFHCYGCHPSGLQSKKYQRGKMKKKEE